jgi:peptidyl-prolyl cis-trans isomerase D
MAVIQKIRERYAKLAGFVIALSLVAFIISEGINGSFGNFMGRDTSVAKVGGEKIEQKDYYENVQEYLNLSELFRKGQPMTAQEQAQARQQVLEQMVMEKMVEKDAKKLGLQITEQEQKDMFYGPNPDPTVQQFPYFAGQNGQFDPAMIKQFEQAVKKGGSSQQESEFLVKAGEQWNALKRFLVRNRLVQKYTSLISNATYTPKFMLTRTQQEAGMRAGIRYVKIPYTLVNDAEVKVTDADLTDYMKRHKAMFETNQPTRSIDYVVYDIAPDAQDTSKIMTAITKLQGDFAATNDNEKFVTRNSDDAYQDVYITKTSYPSQFADSIFNQPVGAVYGPYFENGGYRLTKVTAKTTLPDSVKVRHILIKTAEQDRPALDSNIAKARIDSIQSAIAAGADFKAMVTKYSDDEGSKATGGEYDFTLQQRAGISKEFGDVLFDGKTGDKKVVKVSNSQYSGYHYMEVLDQKNPVTAVKLATVSKELITSSRSSSAVISKANKFAGNNNTAAAFDAAVKKEGLSKREAENIKSGDFIIPGIGPARELVRWVYNAKEGEVSNPIQLENRYIVAKVSGIREKGLPALNAGLRAQLEGMVKAEMKGKKLAEKYGSAASLEAIAQASGQMVQTADSLKGGQSFAEGIGYEPKVMGYIFSDKLQLGKMSPALKGREAVYFISLTYRTPSAVTTDPMMQQQQMMESMQTRNYVSQMLTEAMRRNTSVTFNAKNIQ